MKDLNHLYRTANALTKLDHQPEGFQWINCDDYQSSIVTFMRKTDTADEMLVVVANFSGIAKEHTLGVPFKGKYKEILNTDDKKYAGSGLVNTRQKIAKKHEWDGQPYCITIDIAPQSVSILRYRGDI